MPVGLVLDRVDDDDADHGAAIDAYVDTVAALATPWSPADDQSDGE
jgi:hypothetical protein